MNRITPGLLSQPPCCYTPAKFRDKAPKVGQRLLAYMAL
jgi:hypothetical protein